MLLAVVASIIALNRVSDHGVPFSVDDVTCVSFRYTGGDRSQVVVKDRRQIDAITAALRLEIAKPSCCDFEESVCFTVAGENHVALVSRDQFELLGRYRAHSVMPAPFYEIMQAYRDSIRLREPWGGR